MVVLIPWISIAGRRQVAALMCHSRIMAAGAISVAMSTQTVTRLRKSYSPVIQFRYRASRRCPPRNGELLGPIVPLRSPVLPSAPPVCCAVLGFSLWEREDGLGAFLLTLRGHGC